jgi:HPt (histidine-containing phosphotransfer) domain-containing protein
MTAGAMKGDRERCLQAGMDGYVAKPIEPELLYDEIVRWTNPSNRPAPDTSAAEAATDGGVIDVNAAKRLCRNDDERMRSLARTLLDESSTLVEDIRIAMDNGDVEAFRRFVHTLKGSAGVFGANAVVNAALRIQDITGCGSLDGVDDPLTQLLNKVDEMMAALQQLADA